MKNNPKNKLKKSIERVKKTTVVLYGDKVGFEREVARRKKALARKASFQEDSRCYADITEDEKGKAKFADYCARHEVECALVRALECLRWQSNMSQYELAKRGTISYGKISRMEYWGDDKLTIGNIKGYLAGLGYRLCVSFEKIPDKDEAVPD